MKKTIQIIAVLLAFASCASASETARHAMLGRMFTSGDYFGFPGEPSAPFTCNGGVERSTYYDTTAHVAYFCNGTSWTAMSGSAHNLLSATHSDTLAASVSRGDILRGNSTPAWSRLALGSTGLYLKSNGTDLLYSTLAASGVGSCTNQFVSALTADSAPTCSTVTLAGAQFANQGTTSTVLHGAAAGNPSFGAVALTTDVSGILPQANGGMGLDMTGHFGYGSKALGSGNVSVSFLRVTLTTGTNTGLFVSIRVLGTDGTENYSVFENLGFQCEDKAGTVVAGLPTIGSQNSSTINSNIAVLTGSTSITTANASHTCDLVVSITYTVGSATASTVYYQWLSATNATVTGL